MQQIQYIVLLTLHTERTRQVLSEHCMFYKSTFQCNYYHMKLLVSPALKSNWCNLHQKTISLFTFAFELSS